MRGVALGHMQRMDSVEQRKVLVVGLGKTGLSCARFLSRLGCQIAVTDNREQPPGLEEIRRELPDIALFVGQYEAAAFENADQIIVSPGVPMTHPLLLEARSRGIEVIGDIELFARHVKAPVVAITGSNGKSTVTTLVYEMVRQAGRKVLVGGNLGTPALDLLAQPQPDLYVLELSSFQLETVSSLQLATAVILNVSPDHMDRYQGFDDYAAAKARIYRHAVTQIVNLDDPMVVRLTDKNRPVLGFTLNAPGEGEFGVASTSQGPVLAFGDETLLPVSEIRMAGRHNQANALAALAAGHVLGLPRIAMLETLRTFGGLPHRTEWVTQVAGVDWYNDSKGTNVGATLAAISGFDHPVVLIAGGQGKGADFSPLHDVVCSKARAVVLIGQDAALIEQALQGCTPVVHAGSMDEAVQQAAKLAQPGDVVLLSPACASFDMFNGYEDRGEKFVEAVGRCVA